MCIATMHSDGIDHYILLQHTVMDSHHCTLNLTFFFFFCTTGLSFLSSG
jgi:hypothetical protein